MKGRKHKKMASGGAMNLYNAKGSPEAHEAEEKSDGFKRGGAKKAGGHVGGEKSAARMDKKPRGRKLAAGGTPYSSAHKSSDPQTSKAGSGHAGDMPPETN